MKLSAAGIDAIKRRETCKLEAYKDEHGLWTIGWGHLLTQSELTSGKCQGEDWRHGITQAAADTQLADDVEWAERAVDGSVTVPLMQNQFDALVSFAFNVGAAAFRDSTLVKRLNDDRFAAVPLQMRRWVYVGPLHSNGLESRRESEIRQWESA